MNEEIQALVRKSRKALEAGRLMLSGGFPEQAASEAYYAMFYAAKAMLLREGKRLKQHKQVIRAFKNLAAKTGRSRFYDLLSNGFKLRHFAAYETDLVVKVSEDRARAALNAANEFLNVAEEYLEARPT